MAIGVFLSPNSRSAGEGCKVAALTPTCARAGGAAAGGAPCADQFGHSDSEGNTSGEAGLGKGAPGAASTDVSPALERQGSRSQTQMQRIAGAQVSPAPPLHPRQKERLYMI